MLTPKEGRIVALMKRLRALKLEEAEVERELDELCLEEGEVSEELLKEVFSSIQ